MSIHIRVEYEDYNSEYCYGNGLGRGQRTCGSILGKGLSGDTKKVNMTKNAKNYDTIVKMLPN